MPCTKLTLVSYADTENDSSDVPKDDYSLGGSAAPGEVSEDPAYQR